MSLKTWKKEFYPKKPSKRMTKLEAVQHSLRKWQGLTKANLDKHEISTNWLDDLIDTQGKEFGIDAVSCALCIKFFNLGGDDEHEQCGACPLYTSLGNKSCGFSRKDDPYSLWKAKHDPNPMIRALKRTLKMVEKEMQ